MSHDFTDIFNYIDNIINYKELDEFIRYGEERIKKILERIK